MGDEERKPTSKQANLDLCRLFCFLKKTCTYFACMSDSNLFYKKKKSKKLNRRTHRKTENPTLPCQTLINVTTKSCTAHHWFFREKITKIVHLYNVGCTRITHFVHLDSYPILLFKALFFIYWLFFFFFLSFFLYQSIYNVSHTHPKCFENFSAIVL